MNTNEKLVADVRRKAQAYADADKAAIAAEEAFKPYQRALLRLQEEYDYVGLTDAMVDTKGERYAARKAYHTSMAQLFVMLINNAFQANPGMAPCVKVYLRDTWGIEIYASGYDNLPTLAQQFNAFAERVAVPEFMKKREPLFHGDAKEPLLYLGHTTRSMNRAGDIIKGNCNITIPTKILDELDDFVRCIEEKTEAAQNT